jgi:hypothetical protein
VLVLQANMSGFLFSVQQYGDDAMLTLVFVCLIQMGNDPKALSWLFQCKCASTLALASNQNYFKHLLVLLCPHGVDLSLLSVLKSFVALLKIAGTGTWCCALIAAPCLQWVTHCLFAVLEIC